MVRWNNEQRVPNEQPELRKRHVDVYFTENSPRNYDRREDTREMHTLQPQ